MDKTKKEAKGMLSPYRVLDLTDEKGLLCGKLLGDFGADVIKVEKPGGDPARNLGPFYHDDPDPEKSLFWYAYSNNKRGITLDIETADGQGLFKRLVKDADFVIESFPPGYMDKLGLGYPALEKVNPGVIMVSISPFGQTGPYKDYKAPDIVAWAMGGMMYISGDPDRPPVRISYHSQAYLHVSVEAAAGAMSALHYRETSGGGQWVDVSIQEAVAQSVAFYLWDIEQFIGRRRGAGQFDFASPQSGSQTTRFRVMRRWPCKDGYVTWFLWFGPMAKRHNPQLVKWMESEGLADDFLKNFDWSTFDATTATQETIDRISEPIASFFRTRTKVKLHEGAAKHGIALAPVYSAADILESIQLADRGYWVEVSHPEIGTSITYPGVFTHTSEAPPKISRRAPLIGEHNYDIYHKELCISDEDLIILKEAKVI
ncbi:CaiB/BaiF CoA transferase family protein [Chloroflexota bacterium]